MAPPIRAFLPEGPARRALGVVSSPALLAALAVPPLTAAAWAAARGLPLARWTDAAAVRLWCVAAAAALVAGVASAVLQRRWPRALAAAGGLALLAQPFASRAFAFSGECDLVLGAPAQWTRAERGWGAPPPPLELAGPSPGGVRLRVAGAPATLRIGETRTIAGARVTATAAGAAPAFAILDGKGAAIEGGLYRLSTDAGFIEVPTLPHRFSLAPAEGAPVEASTGLPSELEVRIRRGKLSLFAGRLAAGAEAPFDGLRLVWSEGSRWASARVERRPTPALALAGIFLLVDAAVVAWVGRRR